MTDFSLAEGRKVVGDYAVYPNSLLFKAGHYADKNLTMTEGDIAAAASGFIPVDFNVEHSKHGAHQALAGAFGGVLRSWVDTADPKNLRGEVAIPLWLDERLEKKSPSLEFNKASKQICGAALTYTPRVAEAAFMSAIAEFAQTADFANTRHNTPEGQTVMQDLHDTAARAGAICDKKNAEMSSQHEATAIQKIHDMTMDHGATCSKGEAPSWAKSMFSAIHPTISNPAEPIPATHTRQGEKSMSETTPWYSRLIPTFKKAGASDEDIEASFSNLPIPSGMSDADRAEFNALKSAHAELQSKSIKSSAEAFIDSQIAASRVFPAERSTLIASFTQAAEDDAATPKTVTFSVVEDGKEEAKSGSRTQALIASINARPTHNLLKELVSGETYFSLGAHKSTTKEEENKKLDDDVKAWAEKQNRTGANHTPSSAGKVN